MSFLKDLKFGKIYEKELLKYLDYENYNFSIGNFKPYDLEIIKNNISIYYEIKADRISYITNNISIEYECNNKLSGISSTTSNYYAYFVIKPNTNYDLYIIPTEIIRDNIINKTYKKSIVGGDNYKSKMYLFDIKIFNEYKIYISYGD